MLQIAKLGYASFGARDVEALATYYRDVIGFAETEDAGGDGRYLTSGLDHHTVALHPAGDDGIRHIAFQLGGEASLEDARAHLADLGTEATLQSDPEPGISQALAFDDPEGNSLQLYREMAPSGAGFGSTGIRPNKLGHICLRASDVAGLTDWYERALGFRWSDWMGDFFVFIRCGADHHTLNLLKGPEAGNVLHHIAYELREWADVQPACDVLFQAGISLEWGPGRHGPGHNIYTYHRNPAGHIVELFTQLDVMNEQLGCFEPRPWHEDTPQRPKRWEPDRLAPNRWGVPPPEGFI